MDKDENEKKQTFLSVMDQMINKAADEESVAFNNSPMLSNPALAGQYIKEIRKKHTEKTFDILRKELDSNFNLLDTFREQLKVDNVNLFEKFNSTSNDINEEQLNENLKLCKTKEDVEKLFPIPFSAEEIKELYELGKKHFENKYFEKALLYFHFLVTIDQLNVTFWISKAATEQNLMNYEGAISSYVIITKLKPGYFMPYLLIIDCLILNNQLVEAKQNFEGILNSVDPEEYSNNDVYVSKINDIKEILINEA
jgi:tetratricopeptide (TPR) repeat protein